MDLARKQSIRAGFIVTFSGILAVLLIVQVSGIRTARNGFSLFLKFKFLNNLSVGAPVLLNGGSKIGSVLDIYQKNQQTFVKIYVTNSLRNKIPLVKETRFSIFSVNLMGQKYVNLTAPDITAEKYIQPDEVIEGISPPSIDQMMLSFSGWFDGKDGKDVLDDIIRKSMYLKSQLNAIAEENRDDLAYVSSGAGNLVSQVVNQFNVLQKQFGEISGQVQDVTISGQEGMNSIFDNLKAIGKNVENVNKAMDASKGNLSRFSKDKKLSENTKAATQYAGVFVKCLKENPWVLIYKEPCP